jgi:hypothetical protein
VDLEATGLEPGERRLGGFARADQRRHRVAVAGRGRRVDVAGIDQVDPDAGGAQVEVQRLGEVDQRRLRGPVDERLRQAAVAGDARDDRQPAGPLREQHRQDRGETREHRPQVGVEHPARRAELETLRAHRLVDAGDPQHEVDAAPARLQRVAGGGDRVGVVDVERQDLGRTALRGGVGGQAARRGGQRLAQRVGAARRHRDPGASPRERAREFRADPARGADDPDAASRPALDRRVHRAEQAGRAGGALAGQEAGSHGCVRPVSAS